MNILVIEPYYGGSHKVFLDGLSANLPLDFTLLTLPARKWKWRMRLAAPYFIDKIILLHESKKFDAVLCSSFIDVATIRSLLPHEIAQLTFFTYFHENQFAYPVQKDDERDFHFGLTNLTTVLASDRVAFNTQYNLDTFLAGVDKILHACPDMKLDKLHEKIMHKTSILHPGIDFSPIDNAENETGGNVPVIIWNHRWEYDKNPEYFFDTLFKLEEQNIDFRLIVTGQSFREKPAIFSRARERLKNKIIHFGYVESEKEYYRLLKAGDVVISTARHEFYGIAVIEAVRAGCIPLLPNSLSYPELFPAQYLYEEEELFSRLQSMLDNPECFNKSGDKYLTERFSWTVLKEEYLAWFNEAPS